MLMQPGTQLSQLPSGIHDEQPPTWCCSPALRPSICLALSAGSAVVPESSNAADAGLLAERAGLTEATSADTSSLPAGTGCGAGCWAALGWCSGCAV